MTGARPRTGGFVAALLVMAAALVGCSTQEQPTPAPVTGVAKTLNREFGAVVENVLPSVVEITRDGAVGSGVVFDNRGDIVTNAHVVGRATAFEVRLAHSSTVRQATLVYAYPTEDLAVIRLTDTGGLVPARFGDSGKLQVGDIVMAMGSPLGLESSVTQGIVSALGRTVSEPPEPQIGLPGTVLRQTIQTSAPINPGNIAHELARQMIENGRVVHSGRASLGIAVATVTNERREPVGAGVAAVDPGGPAAAAGVQLGDLITRIDDSDVRTAQDLQSSIAAHQPGDAVRLTLTRAPTAEPHTLTITLGELPVDGGAS